MLITDRIMKIRNLLIHINGSVDSRKKLHKLIYLLQELGEDFDQDYIYHYYGVFSPSLASDIDWATESENAIFIEKHNLAGYTYKINKDVTIKADSEIDFRKEIIDHAKELADYDARLLETLSTVVYLGRNHYSGNKLKTRLKELKPDHKEHYKKAFKLAKEKYALNV